MDDILRCFDVNNQSYWKEYMNIYVKYNRMILFRADLWHSYGVGFGNELNNSMKHQKSIDKKMSDKRGIFSLEEFYDLQVSGESTDIFDVFKYVTLISDNQYFAGGYPSYNPESRITRYDYSNDTVSDASTLVVLDIIMVEPSFDKT